MSQKKNHEPRVGSDERHQSIFRLKSDSTEPASPLNELRTEALAYGIALELEMQLDGTSISIPAPGGLKPAGDTSLPAQAQEILQELLTKHYLKLVEAVNRERRTRGQKTIEDAAVLAKRQTDFEKAYYGKLRDSEQGRRVVDLLKAWRGSLIMEQHGRCSKEDSARIAWLEPLLHSMGALGHDAGWGGIEPVEFFRLLAKAAQMLDTRVRSSKAIFGAGDFDLTIWLLQYGITIAGTPTHTVRELNEQFVSKFHRISDKKLHERLHELGIPHRDEARGKASPNYGKVLNLPLQRKKSGKF
jgi:hypothetical protein